MTTEAGLITDEELIHMPDDGYRYELVRGELVQKPLPGHRHGRLVGYLVTISKRWSVSNTSGNL